MVRAALVLATLFGATAPAFADERSLFFMPGEGDFRHQSIAKGPNEQKWPFAETSGQIACAWVMGSQAVYFIPQSEIDGPLAEDEIYRVLIVSVNVLEMMISNAAQRDLLLPMTGLEEQIKRIAPYYSIGLKLCDMQRGTVLGPAEL
jgi:hypothetical protein